MLKSLHRLEVLNEHWPDLLLETEAILYMNGTGHYKKACRAFLDKVLIQFEQILVYFISTYFCGAVYDGEVLAKAQMPPSVPDRSSTCGSHATLKMGMSFPKKKKSNCYIDTPEKSNIPMRI